MIGVIFEEKQRPFVVEFFELFKVPWEFYVNGRVYDVVIVAGHTDALPNAKLLILFGSEKQSWDVCHVTRRDPNREGALFEYKDYKFPVYQKTAQLDAHSTPTTLKPMMRVLEATEVVGVEYVIGGQRCIRIGYDLFDEVEYLLSQGQPVEHAEIPTLDIHINLLREWIIDSGLLLVEIPPRPSGYNFTVCLTHDVDFINIRDHKIDRSVIGFMGRALFPNRLRDSRSRIVWQRLLRNWRAVLSLPAVYLGLCRDVWFDIDRYMELENGLDPTYFFIPIKGHPGNASGKTAPHWRAAHYDPNDYQSLIDDLKEQGSEIGIHGIDAWQDSQDGARERQIMSSISRENCVGIRMHWLYFSTKSPRLLEESGYNYDSTIGYNEAIGFRSGTTQVFCLPGTSKVFELPLNVMDTALFYPDRMNLPEAEALDVCKGVINALKNYGGVITINWHTRSLSPERNWDSFYIELLDMLKNEKVWFANAKSAVHWYSRRRLIRFDAVDVTPNGVKVKLSTSDDNNSPGFVLRVHEPSAASKTREHGRCRTNHYVDIPLTGEPEIEVVV